MKNRSTKRALALSFVSLLLCVSMFVGTTFAWFTDSVSSTNNIIKSGNLDVELEYYNGTKWEAVGENTNVFTGELWEPGHTEVVKLKVVNAGTLALKYNLGVNIASETASENVLGDMFKLSDYIKYGVVEGDQDYTRETAIEAVEDSATRLNITYSKNGELAAGKDAIVTMVVYMPTTVGNEANYAKGAAEPTINLGINLFATQVEAESDSFGDDYDANAPFSVWNGVVPTEMPESLVVDGATQTVHVKDAAAFAYLSTLSAKWVELYTDGNGRDFLNYANGAGADYYYCDRWTVSLEADIDLGNHAITPVNIKIGESTGASAFNGNGHTIRNINTTTGLFADKARSTFSNINLVNVKATNGALIGSSDHGISNVTVQNATISGVDYVGGLVGYIYGAVNGCKVLDSSVVATGKEAGGLIGYVATSNAESTVANNVVKNVSVFANNRAAGLVAQPNANIKVYNNIIDTVTVGVEDASKYQAGAVVSNALVPENVYDNEVKNANVYAKEVELVEDNASLKAALNSGAEYINANGANLGSLNYGLNTTTVPAGKTLTIFNANFEGKSYGNAVNGTVVFENCTFTNTGAYSIHFDAGNGDVIFKNCELYGWNSFGASLNSVSFYNCSLYGNGTYGLIRSYVDLYVENCYVDTTNANHNDVYSEGIEVVSGATLTEKNTTYAVSTADALQEALAAGKNVVLTADITATNVVTLAEISGVEATLNLNGHNITATLEGSAGWSQIFRVSNGAKFTVTGEGKVHATAYATQTYGSVIFNNVGGELFINGGTYTMDYGTYAESYLLPAIVDTNSNTMKATTTINGGEFYHNRNMFRNFAQPQRGANNATLIINGGKFVGEADDFATIWNQKTSGNGVEGDGIVTINGGDFQYMDICNDFTTGVTIADGLNIAVQN